MCATDLFWYLVQEKGQVVPSTGPSTYTKTVTMKEEQWERFKTVKGMTGRMASDYMYVFMCVCMHTCMYVVCMYICMYVNIHT